MAGRLAHVLPVPVDRRGRGQYAAVYPTVALARWQDPLGHAHNYYLHMLAESGLLGLAAYLWLMVAALRAAWKRARKAEGWPRVLALGALGMLGHVLTHSLVDNLYVQDMYLLVAMILGMLLVHDRPRERHRPARLQPAGIGRDMTNPGHSSARTHHMYLERHAPRSCALPSSAWSAPSARSWISPSSTWASRFSAWPSGWPTPFRSSRPC